MKTHETIRIATRGSALALAQANKVLAQCQAAFPSLSFELKIIKTTGDKLQTASLAQESKTLPKGLFTKELEVALLDGSADLAVHSLKDLPTELPPGLKLGAVGGKRENVRDVLIYRDAGVFRGPTPESRHRGYAAGLTIASLPAGAVVATSSTRRKAQLLAHNPALRVPDIRGNVLTRIVKLVDQPELDAIVLAMAGITRLGYRVTSDGILHGEGVPEGLRATILEPDVMLPCVGQGAIGIEIRENDKRLETVCEKLNDLHTLRCVTAERAFLSAMGGGCQSPVAVHTEVVDEVIRMRAVSFMGETVRRAEAVAPLHEAVQLGQLLASRLK